MLHYGVSWGGIGLEINFDYIASTPFVDLQASASCFNWLNQLNRWLLQTASSSLNDFEYIISLKYVAV